MNLRFGERGFRIGRTGYIPVSDAIGGLQAAIKTRRPGYGDSVMGNVQYIKTERWLWLGGNVQTNRFDILAQLIAGHALVGAIVGGRHLLNNQRRLVGERVDFTLLQLVFECVIDGQIFAVLAPNELRLRRGLRSAG